MKKERKTLQVNSLEFNEGQIVWLPRNPRQWTQKDLDLTAESIATDLDFLEDRPPLVVPAGEGFVVFAGNLRLAAARRLKLKEIPVVVYFPEDFEDQETVKRRAMLDNVSFGAWDYDVLGNEWDDLPLSDWGVPVWDTRHPKGEGGPEPEAPQQPGAPQPPAKTSDTRTLEIDGLTPDEFDFVKSKLSAAGESDREGLLNLLGYGKI